MRYETKEEYRAAWNKAGTLTPRTPLNIDLELASVCNLSCPFCFISDDSFKSMISQKSHDGKPRRRFMPTEMAVKIIDEAVMTGVPALKFNWRGESTLHPEFSYILDYAYRAESFLELLINTNANCKENSISGLMRATKIMVSLDSMIQETYSVMRVGGSLELAKSTIRKLINLGHNNIWVRRVVTEQNKHENFYKDVRDYFGDKVHISEHHCIDRNRIASYETNECTHDLLPRTYCKYPSQRLVVASSGLVYPCCIDLHETMPMGDINKQSLKEIWNGKPVIDLRHNLKFDVPKLWNKTCQKCESWMSYDVHQRNFVQDVELTDERPTIRNAVGVS